MQEKSSFTQTKKPGRSGVSIRTQLIFAIGLILVLAYVIAVISYLGFRNIQRVVQTTLNEANRIQELTFEIQNEFLLARQNEADFLASWRSIGFEAASDRYVNAAQDHLALAHAKLNDLSNLVQNANNPDVQPLMDEIIQLRPMLDNYDTAFQSMVSAIQERSRAEGVGGKLYTQLGQLESAVATMTDPKYQFLVLKIRANQQAYLALGRQEYIDNIRLKTDELINLVESGTSSELQGLSIPPTELTTRAESYLVTFSDLVSVVQNANIYIETFRDVTSDIKQTTGRISEISNAGLSRAQNQLGATFRQVTIAIILTALLALGIATMSEVIGTRRILRPIQRLGQTAERLGQGNLSERVNVQASKELDSLADSFNTMAEQLQQTLAGLEDRVSERTRDLERRSTQLQAAAEVARDATSIHQLDTLLSRTVNLVRDRFGFYHAGIFLVDAKGEYAILHAATGEAGQKMLDAGHKLKVGETGIVGYVSGTGDPRIALDVGADAVHFRNPFLPETRSEMALPLKIGQHVIGALDVQSQQSAAFDQNDVTVLQIMADQLAVAIENARLLQESQESLQQLQTLYGQYSQQAWERIKQSSEVVGYQYDPRGVKPILTSTRASKKTAAPPTFSLPLEVRGQVIGTLDLWAQKEQWSPDEINMLKAISERLSQAMESARLFDEVRTRAERERLISEITAKIRTSTNIDIILQTAVQELSKALHISKGAIQLRSGNGGSSNE